MAAETAAATARQPKGNGLGAKYGARDPRTCANRTAPAHGAPSAEQARQYTICEMENGDGIHPLDLITNLKVQVASVSHEVKQIIADLDPRGRGCAASGELTHIRSQALPD